MLTNGFKAQFDPTTCDFQLWAQEPGDSDLKYQVFASDNRLLQIGKGNVDDITIMVDGNVPEFPEVTSRSDSITCNAPYATESEISWTGQVLSEAKIPIQEYKVRFTVASEAEVKFEANLTTQ